MTPRVVRAVVLIGVGALAAPACGAFPGFGDATSGPAREAPTMPDPGFPVGYRRWPAADPVPDEGGGTLHRLYRSPDLAPDRRGRFPAGSVLVKEHVIPGEDDLIVRIDVRRRQPSGTYGGWEYRSYDPATQRQLDIDAEACDLCHQTAPGDGTFTRFAGR